MPLPIVVGGSAIAMWAARERGAADAERRQLRLLADAAQITDGAADIEDALRRLVALLVPDLGDAAWIDVVGGGGELRRLAARVDGDDAAEIEAWLLERPLTRPPGRCRRPRRALARGGAADRRSWTRRRSTAIVRGARGPPPARALRAADDDGRAARGARTARWACSSLGAGRSGRRFDAADAALRRAARRPRRAGARQRAARRAGCAPPSERLDGILGALAEAVTVHDADGTDRLRQRGRGRSDRPGRRGRRCSRPSPAS